MRAVVLLSCLMLLAGCANLQKLKAASPTTEDFSGALASEYLAYGESEYELNHFINAEYYAGKGLKALNGDAVAPEVPDANLPAPLLAELTDARTRLLDVLNDNIKRIAPQKLARAQLLFDCWQHQVVRGMNTVKVPCSEEFKSTLAELQDVSDTFLYPDSFTHSIDFMAGSDRVTLRASDVVHRIAGETAKAEAYVVEITAHPGPGDTAQLLADKRLAAVRAALAGVGIKDAHVRLATQDTTKKVYLGSNRSLRSESLVGVTVKIRMPEAAQ